MTKIGLSGKKFFYWFIPGIFFFILYLISWDKIGQYDAVISAAAVEMWEPAGSWTDLFTENHFLFNALGWLIYRLGAGPVLGLDGYQTLQLISSLAGAFIIAAVMGIFTPLMAGLIRTALGAAFIGMSLTFWDHAAGAEAYLLSSAGVLAALWSLHACLENPTPKNLWLARTMAILPAYLHTSNIILLPMFLWFTVPRNNRALASLRLLLFWSICGIPYIAVHRLYDASSLSYWWSQGNSSVYWYGSRLAQTSWITQTGEHGVSTWRALFGSLAGLGGPGLWAGVVALVCLVLSGSRTSKIQMSPSPQPSPARTGGERNAQTPMKLWIQILIPSLALYSVFFAFWQAGNTTYWATHWMLLGMLAITAPGLGPILRPSASKIILACGFFGVAGMAVSNALTNILPNTSEEKSPNIFFAKEVRRITPEGSLFIISGLKWGELKAYLPYYARRERAALELLLRSAPKQAAMARLMELCDQTHTAGRPIFGTSDLWDPEVQNQLVANWGLEPGELKHFLELFDRRLAMQFAPPSFNKPLLMYRLIPTDHFLEHAQRQRKIKSGMGLSDWSK